MTATDAAGDKVVGTEASATANVAESAIVDDALNAAESTRTTAKWLASALGAIPSLAVVASIVRAPGDGGFDAVLLSIGVVLAAAGGIVGVLAFARVQAPVALEDTDVSKISFVRLPGQSFTSWQGLADQLNKVRQSETDFAVKAKTANRAAKLAEVEAELAQSELDAAEKRAADTPDDVGLKQAARAAQGVHLEAELRAIKAADVARSRVDDHEVMLIQLERLLAIRRDAYRLAATDVVRARFKTAQTVAVLAAVLITAGVILLGLAPKEAPPGKQQSTTTQTM
jgi:hypothetical protein